MASSYFVLITAKFHKYSSLFQQKPQCNSSLRFSLYCTVLHSCTVAQFSLCFRRFLVSKRSWHWIQGSFWNSFWLLTQRVLPDHLPKVLPWCGEAYWIHRYESFLQKSNFHFTIMIWLCSPFQRIVLLLHCFNSHNIWQLPPCRTWGMQ